jgi:hypothetical protein
LETKENYIAGGGEGKKGIKMRILEENWKIV